MKIEKIQQMDGSDILNTQADKRIQMRLNIGNLEFKATNQIDGFSDRIKTLIPSLYSHKCHDGSTNDFFKELDCGISIPHIVAHIAIELQSLAGMEAGFAKTLKSGSAAIHNIEIPYVDQDAGMYAALAAVEIVEALVKGSPYFIRHDIQRLKEIRKENLFAAATLQSMQYLKLNHQAVDRLRYRESQHSIQINQPLQQAT